MCPACASEWGGELPGILKPLPSQAPLKLHNLQQMQILCLALLLHFSLHQLQQQCQWLSTALWQGFPSGPSPGTQAAPLPSSPRAPHSHEELPGGTFVEPQMNEVQKDTQGQAVLWLWVSLHDTLILWGGGRLSSTDICQGKMRNSLEPDQRAMATSKPLQIDLAREDSLEEWGKPERCQSEK